MNSTNVTAELKKKTLKAAKKAYTIRKILQTGSAALACAALVVSAVLFFPKTTPSPDITTETAAKQVYVDDDVPEDEPLVMYADNADINALADLYNNVPGVRRVETLPAYETTDIEALSSRLVRELAAGQGPDIIYLSSNMGMIQSTQTMADAGYFADMDMVINAHYDFNWAVYNKDAMDAVILDGKRYFIPYQYNVPYFVSTEEKFIRLGLSVPEIFDMEAFSDLFDSFYTKAKNGATMFSYFSIYNYFFDVLKDGKIKKDIQTENCFEAVRKEYERHTSQVTSASAYTEISSYINSETLFYPQAGQRNLQDNYNLLDKIRRISEVETGSGEVMLFYNPLSSEESTKGYIFDSFAINANSPLKNEAFDFIKYVLSGKVQMSSEYIRNIPVLKEAFNVQKQSVLYHAEKNGGLELANQMMSVIESANEFEFIQMDIFVYMNVIFKNKDFNGYLEGTVSFEQMVSSVNADLESYPFHKP